MNNKGFTIMELLATIVVLALIMMIVIPSITKLMNNNNEKKYQTYEDMMVEYAIVSEVTPINNVIKLSQLNELADVKKNCIGYVHVIDKSKNQYKAYISCGENGENYQTEGFDESLVG